jgi:hypothetical protein
MPGSRPGLRLERQATRHTMICSITRIWRGGGAECEQWRCALMEMRREEAASR